MYQSTKAIVIGKLRFKDNDLIVKCFTEALGVQSFLVKGVFSASKKKTIHSAYFEYLNVLDITFNFKAGRNLHFIKEVKVTQPNNHISSSIEKTSMTVFIAEIMDQVLDQDYSDKTLFALLEKIINTLNQKIAANNIHLWFMGQLSLVLGFYPDTENAHLPFFNLEAGRFTKTPESDYCISDENLTLLKLLLGTNFDELNTLKFSNQQKRALLEVLLLYFKLHLDDFREPKSLKVLQQVFS